MKFTPTEIPDVILVECQVFRDERGSFQETYHAPKYRAGGIPEPFVQDNHSYSVHGTLRGLHAQLDHPQGKLVRAVLGEIYDVAADVRPGSPTFGRWVGYTLSSDNARQLYVPPGFVHGFCVLSESAHVQYKCTEVYHPRDEISVAWNDPDLAVAWPIAQPLQNAKDSAAPRLAEILQKLEVYRK